MSISIYLENRDLAVRKAQERFSAVLSIVFNEPAFVLRNEFRGEIQGVSLTAVLFLSRFIDMFGDLVEREDYGIESFLRRNREGGFGIDKAVFESWKSADCLRD